ncbi:hypothetical protein ACJMK2_010431 [Sinanodonta woodiana]|uniref:RanBP2-type domain-containing protein n=1 Tax=Sinanodonta woodiana TaxID=1069815 RepID=A0ABD3VIE1_SINWO
MQQFNEAQRLYRSILNGDDPTEERKKIYILIYQFLCLCDPEERFRSEEIEHVILETTKADMFTPLKAAKAFSHLERYLTILYKTPWKREYHRLNTYSGFFQTNITSHLKSADVIFRLIGYREERNGLFVLTKEIDKEQQASVAFECFIASVECKVIHDIREKLLADTVSIMEVVQIRFSNIGNPESIALIINHIHGKIDTPVGQAKPQRQRGSQGDAKQGIPDGDTSFKAPFRDRLHEHLKVAQKHNFVGDKDIPYMDDDSAGNLTEGTLDDHLLASLQLIQKKDVTKISEEKPHMRASQEWSFVNEELERRKKGGIQEQKLIERGMETYPKVKRKVATSQAPLDMKISSERNVSGGLPTNIEMQRLVQQSNVVDSVFRQQEPYKFPISQEFQISSASSRHSVNLPPYLNPLPNAGGFSAPVMARSTDTILSNHPNISMYKKKATTPSASREKLQTSVSAPIAARTNDYKQSYWQCKHCTYRNSEDKFICGMCLNSRDNLETDSPAIRKISKVCANCTLDNSNDNVICDACGCELRNMQTAV